MTKSRFINKPKVYWTKTRVLEEAKKYKTSSEWKRGSVSSHSIACEKGWYKEAIKFFNSPIKILTKKEVFKKALEYNRKVDFMNNAPSHYRKALKKGWINKCCKHMMNFKDSIRSAQKFCWTEELILKEIKNLKSWKDVTRKKGMYAAINKLGIREKLKKNMISGNPIKWTEKELKEEALKYKTRQEFVKNNEFALKKIYNLKLEKKLLKHLIPWKRTPGWTNEKLIEAILECKTRSGLIKRYPGAYKRIQTNKLNFNNLFLDLICEIEKRLLHPKIKRILKKHNKSFLYEEYFFLGKRKIIPDFIIRSRKTIYIIEAKTSGCYYSKIKEYKSIRDQVNKQIKCLKKINPKKKIVHILLSEFGFIPSNLSSYSMSLKEFDYFLKNMKFKKIGVTPSHEEHKILSLKIRNKFIKKFINEINPNTKVSKKLNQNK